ncbi:MAG: phenol hydroxylase subunit [Ottowia sp.]|uniref:phenol hydroxylase subunit n=1 Tax=unclassified Ottowia TaxID=2645081 RepID=UPI003C3053C5
MTETSTFNPLQRFVRIVNVRADGLVEFEFAMGDPRLFVEMLMRRAEFEQFCKDQQVTPTVGALPETTTGDCTPCK